MDERELSAIGSICVFAALADGTKDDAERARIRAVFEGLDPDGAGRALAAAHRRALLGETTPEAEAAQLATPEARALAYEMAVAVCDADGAHDRREGEFLERLRAALDIPMPVARRTLLEADELADLGLDASPPPPPPPPPAGTRRVEAAPEVDEMILRYAVLNGGLELLPQSLATMAIVPLQMKMVYRIGKAHGVSLDRGHLKEFLAAAGVGMSSQVVERFARNLLGGLARKVGGKTAERLVGGATGSAITFAGTYALGQVAKQYYAGGRRLSAVDLRALFTRELAQGKALYATHRSAIEQGAQKIDPARLLSLVRGA